MKNIFLIILLTLVVVFTDVFAQPKRLAYYDAIALDTLKNNNFNALKVYFDILYNYSKSIKGIDFKDSLNNLENSYKNNPFLYDTISHYADAYNNIHEDLIKPIDSTELKEIKEVYYPTNQQEGGITIPSSVASTVSGALPWEATVIAGTTQFLAERFQEEVSQYFLERLRDTLKNNKYFQYLFPSTYSLIQMDGSQWAYGTMFQLLKTSIQSDVQRMPANLNQLIKNVSPFEESLKNSVPLQLVSDLLTIYDDLHAGLHPADILENVNDFQLVQYGKDTALKETIRLLSTISTAMREKKGSVHAWVSLNQIDTLSESQKNYLAGLLFQLVKDDTLWTYENKPYTLELLVANQERLNIKQELRNYFKNFQNQIFQSIQAINIAEK